MSSQGDFISWLKERPRVGDGAMGTMLQRAGLALEGCAEAWNLERPEAVQTVHEAYRAAGAEWLQTNSFGGNRFRLRRAGLGDRVAEVNAAAVRLAREVAGPNGPRVAGTIGPTGEKRAPAGLLSPAGVAEAFAEQAAALAQAGVDLFLIETMTDPAEAVAAIRAARSAAPLPVVATMTFAPDGRTFDGGDPTAAAALLLEASAVAVGANCGAGPAALLPVIERLRAVHPDVPLVAQPSAGLPRWVDGQPVYDFDPAAISAWARLLLDAGATLIGGCCGTTPECIRVMRETLHAAG